MLSLFCKTDTKFKQVFDWEKAYFVHERSHEATPKNSSFCVRKELMYKMYC